MGNIRLKLKEGFLPIVNDKFSIRPGEIVTVSEGTPYDPEVLEKVEVQIVQEPIEEVKEEVVEETKEEIKVYVEPVVEEPIVEEVKEETKTELKFEDLRNINGIGSFAARKILNVVKYKEDLMEKKKELYDKLNDRYVKALLKTYGVI